MRRVIVNIDSLVLKGFRYEDRHAIAAAVERGADPDVDRRQEQRNNWRHWEACRA